jgi:hypothetical protein
VAVSGAVVLERPAGGVRGAAVELDDQAAWGPNRVDLEHADALVGSGRGRPWASRKARNRFPSSHLVIVPPRVR